MTAARSSDSVRAANAASEAYEDTQDSTPVVYVFSCAEEELKMAFAEMRPDEQPGWCAYEATRRLILVITDMLFDAARYRQSLGQDTGTPYFDANVFLRYFFSLRELCTTHKHLLVTPVTWPQLTWAPFLLEWGVDMIAVVRQYALDLLERSEEARHAASRQLTMERVAKDSNGREVVIPFNGTISRQDLQPLQGQITWRERPIASQVYRDITEVHELLKAPQYGTEVCLWWKYFAKDLEWLTPNSPLKKSAHLI